MPFVSSAFGNHPSQKRTPGATALQRRGHSTCLIPTVTLAAAMARRLAIQFAGSSVSQRSDNSGTTTKTIDPKEVDHDYSQNEAPKIEGHCLPGRADCLIDFAGACAGRLFQADSPYIQNSTECFSKGSRLLTARRQRASSGSCFVSRWWLGRRYTGMDSGQGLCRAR